MKINSANSGEKMGLLGTGKFEYHVKTSQNRNHKHIEIGERRRAQPGGSCLSSGRHPGHRHCKDADHIEDCSVTKRTICFGFFGITARRVMIIVVLKVMRASTSIGGSPSTKKSEFS